MTQNEIIQVVIDHSELGQPLKVVKNGENNYSVYAECSDGLVEINPDMAMTQEYRMYIEISQLRKVIEKCENRIAELQDGSNQVKGNRLNFNCFYY